MSVEFTEKDGSLFLAFLFGTIDTDFFLSSLVSRYFVLFFLFFSFSSIAFADDGWNGDCTADLPASFPDDRDWRDAYILKDQEDNSAWQRAILAQPTDSISLKEFESYEITGTARANSPVQLYLYESVPNESGTGIHKPSQGVCLREEADEKGYFVFKVTTRTLWGNTGKDLVIDPYYRMEESWDQAVPQDTNQDFYIGTGVSLRTIRVELPPQTTTAPSMGCSSFGPLELAIDLDPADINTNKISNVFGSVDDEAVRIARVSGFHTFYAGTKTDKAYSATDLAEISMRSVVMETIKRYLLGNTNVASSITESLPEVSVVQLETFADKTGGVADMVKYIQEAMTTDGDDRNVALGRIQQKIIAERNARCLNCSGYPIDALIENIDFWKSLFVSESDDDSWASDFIELLNFWTGGTNQTDSLIQDDSVLGWNYLARYSGYASELECESWKMIYTQGVSPRLLLRTTEPVALSPKFTDIILNSSSLTFDENETWNMPAGEKKELSYEYQTTRPFEVESVANVCMNENTLSSLRSDLSQSFGLSSQELDLVETELFGRIPSEEDVFLPFAIANPSDIAKRILWDGNGEQLNISQLFFRREEGTCPGYAFVPAFSLDSFDSNRDGFEVGMVE
ncbi:hypothetical protein IPN35_00860 [Candidatus Peregrinibacteria bacterium]|nr:MAG: hypothetical protein IPN35_00860 [Candidatus Peregrinibacteria bacterium]